MRNRGFVSSQSQPSAFSQQQQTSPTFRLRSNNFGFTFLNKKAIIHQSFIQSKSRKRARPQHTQPLLFRRGRQRLLQLGRENQILYKDTLNTDSPPRRSLINDSLDFKLEHPKAKELQSVTDQRGQHTQK